jgi:hypothetical protein
MDKKEGGKVSDVGGIDGHRLSPLYYTSIAEINSFRCGKIWFYDILVGIDENV